MVNLRQNAPPRNYLSRSQQWRLLLMVMSLGLVILAIGEARDPANWQWLFGRNNGARAALDAGDGPNVDNRLNRSSPNELPGTFVSPAPVKPQTGAPGRYFPGVDPKLLEAVRDDTTFRKQESPAWFNLLDVLRKTDQATLRRASTGRVTFAQLFNQSKEYRGELVTVRGTLRRVHRLDAPENDLGIESYYQTWLQPADNRSLPMVVYCLTLPEGFPTGMDLSAEVEITAFHFKRWAYKAQDTIRTTPALLARTVSWQKDGEASPGPLVEQAAWPESTPTKPAKQIDAEPTQTPIASPRELLRMHGIDESHFANLVRGRPVDDNETETLLKVMYRVCRFGKLDVYNWARHELNPAELAEDPEENLGQIFAFSGRVTKLETRRLLPEIAERLEMKEYYRCELQIDVEKQDLGQQRQPLVVFARNVPRQWLRGEPIDEPVSGLGLLLKFASQDSDRPVPVLVTQRIAWHPDNLLGNLGMDVGLFDEVKNRKKLAAEEREAFYQMLAAAGRAEPGQLMELAQQQLQREGKDSFSVVPLFMDPQTQHGRLVSLSGTVRRAVRIRVEEPDIVERFGIDHYYELALFTDDSEDNPLFFCVRRLPEGMPTGEGPGFGEHVQVAGFFFKLRLYRISPLGGDDQSPRGQLAPLLFGREPVWHPRVEPPPDTMLQAIVGGLFVAVLLGIWLGLWRYARGDKRFQQQTLSKAHGGDSGISLSEIELNADGEPDFSRLEKMDRSGTTKDEG